MVLLLLYVGMEYVGIYEILWSHLEIVEQCKYSNIKLFHEFMLTGLCHDFYFMPGQQKAIVVYIFYHYFFGSRFFHLTTTFPFTFPENKQLYLNFNPRMQALHHMHRNLHILEKSLKYVL